MDSNFSKKENAKQKNDSLPYLKTIQKSLEKDLNNNEKEVYNLELKFYSDLLNLKMGHIMNDNTLDPFEKTTEISELVKSFDLKNVTKPLSKEETSYSNKSFKSNLIYGLKNGEMNPAIKHVVDLNNRVNLNKFDLIDGEFKSPDFKTQKMEEYLAKSEKPEEDYSKEYYKSENIKLNESINELQKRLERISLGYNSKYSYVETNRILDELERAYKEGTRNSATEICRQINAKLDIDDKIKNLKRESSRINYEKKLSDFDVSEASQEFFDPYKLNLSKYFSENFNPESSEEKNTEIKKSEPEIETDSIEAYGFFNDAESEKPTTTPEIKEFNIDLNQVKEEVIEETNEPIVSDSKGEIDKTEESDTDAKTWNLE